MPKFPTYERGQGLRAGSTASYASEGAFTAPARALANMGGAVADLGATVEAGEQRIRNTQSDAWLSKARAETALEMQTLERDLQKSATEGAADYTPTAQARYEELRKAKLAQAPSPRAAQAYQQWSDGFGVDVVGRASRFQAESELAKRTSDFADAMTAHAQVIYSDPSQYEAVHKRAMDDFAGAKQWMTPEQETAAREKVDHDLKLARAKSLVEFAPGDFLAEVKPAGGAAAALRKFEGFRSTPYWDVNAFRVGYGSDTITRADGSVVKVTKDMKVSRADAERDLARRTKEFEAGAIRDVGMDAWAALPENTRAALVSVAYNYGSLPGSVKAAVRSGDNERIAVTVEGLGGHNGGINSKRRRDEAAIIRGGALPDGGGFVSDERYAGLSVDEIRSLSNQADTAVTAQQTTAYAQMKDSLNLGIVTGDVISEDQILGAGLDDGDTATMLTKFREARKDEIAIAEVGQAIMDKSFSGDPYDADTRKAVDGLSSAAKKVGTPEQNRLLNEEIVRQSGIVPKDVVNAIRKGLESTNAAEVAAAAQQASRISAIDPAALGRRDGGKEAQNAADDFAHMVNNLNMTPEEAGQRIIDMNDPEKKRERKAIEPAAKEFVKEMQDFSLANEFDTFFGAEPEVGFSPGQALGIQAEFLAIAEEQFYAANGDPEIAQNRAVEQMKRLYGVTELTGRKVVMKHPPEMYWPKSAIGTTSPINPNAPGAPSLAYAQQQLEADIREHDPEVDMSKVQLVTTPQTDAMVKGHEMPGYAVIWVDENGMRQTIPGKLWRPDAKKAGEFNVKQEEQRIEDARVDSDEWRELTRGVNRELEGAGMQDSPIMSEDPNAVNLSPGMKGFTAEEFREKNKELGIRTQYRRTN